MSNITVPVNSKMEQREEVLAAIEKNGINRKFIKRVDYLKRSIDSRSKNSIKFIYSVEIETENSFIPDNSKNYKVVAPVEEIKRRVLNRGVINWTTLPDCNRFLPETSLLIKKLPMH